MIVDVLTVAGGIITAFVVWLLMSAGAVAGYAWWVLARADRQYKEGRK